MVRGYQKRIIHLKSTESAVFDEAFFLVNEEKSRGMGESELIREANRIVDESLRNRDKKMKRIKERFCRVGVFLLGAAASSVIWLLLTIV